MRRRILTITAFLLLGAIVNVAVAWAGNLQWTQSRERHFRSQFRGGLFTPSGEWLDFEQSNALLFTQIDWSAGLSDRHLDAVRMTRMRDPPSWALVPSLAGYQQPRVDGHRTHLAHQEVGSGFPMISLQWCGRNTMGRLDPITAVIRLEDRIVANNIGNPWRVLRVLPLHAHWPGFAINTLLYAAILWLLFAAPFALRRWRRNHRGLCPKCAYPIGTNAVCTECGATLPSPSANR